ncbi:MAG: pyruvate ferredoxin oxidoreductase [Candidatus Bipolaricaulota bacterium]|nr:pyruvate ferredoxin oxidoreductase [Candidatus Bipolaricaulota bacterium]MCS7274092.1 pyruvate ferredoxin oxidoreductase [Candidatus Bipolaricaulota bacterium]MDW8110689.1 pyruvate ferredoxin oxidoreductase [Candidatus Bipolaricaulota bacterium]MDW8328453.1 pyruvate ferredoxin oxidoreductase [Candidatus Bipolaricaulota bacterium]
MEREERTLLTGAEAAAHAMRQLRPAVVPVYPITPQTPIIETFAQFVADGLVDTEIINVESEHSAMSAAVGASCAGARVLTATSSQGLALMLEICYIASAMRCPIGMAVGSRALSGPINIHCDHSDSMMARDAGWIQIFCENAQEAYDLSVVGQRLAEDGRVLLPVMTIQDGFTITHSAEPVALLPDDAVAEFVGEYQALYPLLDTDHPTTQGPFALPDYYFEIKRQQVDAMANVGGVWSELQEEFAKLSGRYYRGVFEAYKLDDADYVYVILGATAGTAKVAIDRLRRQRKRVGLLKLWLFRPFPAREIAQALQGRKAVAILDRALSLGSWGPLYSEISAALNAISARPVLYNYIYGLGGRDIRPEQLMSIVNDLECEANADVQRFIGLRE